MSKINFITAGESHGPILTAIINGLPAGFKIDIEKINEQLQKRQQGYGRGGRMKIEKDSVSMLSGVRNSVTLGSPITLQIINRDFSNWEDTMDPIFPDTRNEKVEIPRPGHADYAGVKKYGFDDIRNVLERSSARETAIRVAVGSLCRQFLENIGIKFFSHVKQIGKISISETTIINNELLALANNSPVRCIEKSITEKMKKEIDNAKSNGDSVGGIFQVVVKNLPIGLGSYIHWDERLSSQISSHILGIPAIKGIEFGEGFNSANISGKNYHDEFIVKNGRISRTSNNAGGFEGGMTNGEPLIINAVMKPIPTLTNPLKSFNIRTKEKAIAHKERTDSCAVPAASVVAENVIAIPLLDVFLERFGRDSWEIIKKRFKDENYIN
ncbi:MAG: chorismate synthase [Candidatus Marinimicrobia bacterium]|nr:chorismate synthase [Candidatus Neomarinimicrobiota bacterium]